MKKINTEKPSWRAARDAQIKKRRERVKNALPTASSIRYLLTSGEADENKLELIFHEIYAVVSWIKELQSYKGAPIFDAELKVQSEDICSLLAPELLRLYSEFRNENTEIRIGIAAWLPYHSFHPGFDLFIKSIGLPAASCLSQELGLSLPSGLMPSGLSLVAERNRWVADFKSQLETSAYKVKESGYIRTANKDIQSFDGYVTRLYMAYGSLQYMNAKLGYPVDENGSICPAPKHFEVHRRMILSWIKKQANLLVGYVWKVTFTVPESYRLHLVFFFNPKEAAPLNLLWRQLSAEWRRILSVVKVGERRQLSAMKFVLPLRMPRSGTLSANNQERPKEFLVSQLLLSDQVCTLRLCVDDVGAGNEPKKRVLRSFGKGVLKI